MPLLVTLSLLPLSIVPQAYVVMEGPQVGDIEASPPKLPPAARLLGSLGFKRSPQSPTHRALSFQAPGAWHISCLHAGQAHDALAPPVCKRSWQVY